MALGRMTEQFAELPSRAEKRDQRQWDFVLTPSASPRRDRGPHGRGNRCLRGSDRRGLAVGTP